MTTIPGIEMVKDFMKKVKEQTPPT